MTKTSKSTPTPPPARTSAMPADWLGRRSAAFAEATSKAPGKRHVYGAQTKAAKP